MYMKMIKFGNRDYKQNSGLRKENVRSGKYM